MKKNESIDELTKQNQRLAIINQVARNITVQMSYEDIIDQLADPLRQVIAYDLLSFCLLEGETLVIKASVPKEQKILGVGTILKKENSAPWQAVLKKQCFLRQDIVNDPHPFQEDRDLLSIGMHSAVMAPMLVNNQVIGTLNLGSKQTYVYSEKDFLFVQQLADQLAVSIQNMRLYAEMYKAQKEWEETFKAVQDHIFLLGPGRQVLRVNNPVEGISIEEMTGRDCREAFAFCDGRCSDCLIEESYQTERSVSREISLNNRRKILNVFTYPVFGETNNLNCLVVYIKDVTVKRKLETQLFQSAKLAAIGEMAAGVAHELNSPLTAIIGNSNILLRRTGPEQPAFKMLQDIKNCGQRCKRIIQNLLTFSRRDSYSFKPVNINEVVDNSLALVAYQINKNNIDIEKRYSRNLPLVMGNEQQLEQVIINLLLNARDALEGASKREINVTTELEEVAGKPVVSVTIADSGTGIDPENIRHIFNPFYTTKESTRGTGLGLSVSLGIAETHGGTLKVQSEPGRGSRFSLILPL